MMYLRERHSAARRSRSACERASELPAVTTSRSLKVKHPGRIYSEHVPLPPPSLPGEGKRGGRKGDMGSSLPTLEFQVGTQWQVRLGDHGDWSDRWQGVNKRRASTYKMMDVSNRWTSMALQRR